MSITFKDLEGKKLSDFMEMGVSFGKGEGEKFESWGDFEDAIYESKVKSSQYCDYDNQELAWREIANAHRYDGIKEMVGEIMKLASNPIDTFPGMEGLAAISGNPKLMEACDYGNIGSGDAVVMSMFYGGPRMKNWIKNCKDKIQPQHFVDELKDSDEMGQISMFGISNIEDMGGGKVKVSFGDDSSGAYSSSPEKQEGKDEFHKLLVNGDGLFDFEIAENADSDVWTIKIKKA